ncbi:MAG: SHOCT domain-containing protein [Bryobacteraceae bacterium]
MKHIHWGSVQAFVSIVRERMGKKESVLTVAGPDLAEQIERLASLRDRGLLTDEEFQAKKKQMLGI